MDDDGKIKRIQNFLALESEKLPKNSGGISYDFEKSYASTSKNLLKNLKPIFVIMGITLLSVGILTLALNLFVNYKNNKIAVEVQEFNDLNLRRLLNLVGGTQERINEALNEKHRLEAQKTIDLNQAENERSVALKTLYSLNLKKSEEIKQREALIEKTYKTRMEKIRALDTEIASCDEIIRLGQQQLAEYDSRSLEQATSQRAELDSDRQLYELEKQGIVDFYEERLSEMRNALSELSEADLKRQKEEVEYAISQYDPTFLSDAEAQMLVKEENTAFAYKSSASALDSKAPQSLFSALKQQDSSYNKIKALSSRFNSIPQKNAIPTFAFTMEKIAAKTLKNTADSAVEAVNSLILENEKLSEQKTNPLIINFLYARGLVKCFFFIKVFGVLRRKEL